MKAAKKPKEPKAHFPVVPVEIINEILHAAVNVSPAAGTIQPRADFAEVLKALRHKHGSSDDFAAAEKFVNSMLRRQTTLTL